MQLYPQLICLVKFAYFASNGLSGGLLDECQLLHGQRLHSYVSSTALRQHGGSQNRPTPKDQPSLIRKVMSGAVNNAS